MRKMVIALLALGVFAASSAFASNPVRISQYYGGGGGSTGTYMYDYVELFNFSNAPVNIGGWSIQYDSSTSTSGFGNGCTTTYCNLVCFPNPTIIPACGYYLIQVGSAGSGGAPLSPAADLVSSLGPNMGPAGKLALISSCIYPTACPVGGPIGGVFVDAVSCGPTSVCAETAPVPGTHSAIKCDIRNGGGMVDTDNNSADFTLTSAPWVIHNSLTPPRPECLIVPADNRSWGQIKMIYR